MMGHGFWINELSLFTRLELFTLYFYYSFLKKTRDFTKISL